jgi:hypothetical protein
LRIRTITRCFTLNAVALALAGLGLSACSSETGDSTVATEQGITQDINAVRGRSTTPLPAGERLVQQPSNRESSGPSPAGPRVPLVTPSGSANIDQAPAPGNPRVGHDFAVGTCTPCHVVSPDQKSPLRFADAPDFRAIANAPGTTAIRLNIWLTNPHPTMPKLVLYPQEASDVIAYILSLRERG